MQLTKKDVAVRQLVEAIRMFFGQRDPVSTHTLSAAARQVLADLAGHLGLVGILDDARYIRPERLHEFRGIIAAPENFFKHADRDPNAVFEFPESLPMFLLIDACVIFQKLYGHSPNQLALFMGWVALRHPHLIDQEVAKAWVDALKAEMPDPLNLRAWAAICETI